MQWSQELRQTKHNDQSARSPDGEGVYLLAGGNRTPGAPISWSQRELRNHFGRGSPSGTGTHGTITSVRCSGEIVYAVSDQFDLIEQFLTSLLSEGDESGWWSGLAE
jgi:hypothetical protein